MTASFARLLSGASSRRVRAVAAFATVMLLIAAALTPQTARAQDDADPAPYGPVDPQNWVDQEDLTWDAYTPIRPEAWNVDTTSTGSQNQYRTAIVLMDFPDQPFLIAQAAGSHPFGNPQPGWQPVPAGQVNQWYDDYYSIPSEYNGGQTLHGYWMETSHGRIGVTVDTYGQYTMPGKSFEYGIASDFQSPVNNWCPQGHTCNRNIRTDGNAPFRAEVIANGGTCPGTTTSNCGYNNLFYVTAGHDETSTWQEFGEMLFTNQADVPASLGPPGATEGPVLNNNGVVMTNWASTRYVPWTSWRSSANHWPNASNVLILKDTFFLQNILVQYYFPECI
jgi:M6 family metalloprotease-like protein